MQCLLSLAETEHSPPSLEHSSSPSHHLLSKISIYHSHIVIAVDLKNNPRHTTTVKYLTSTPDPAQFDIVTNSDLRPRPDLTSPSFKLNSRIVVSATAGRTYVDWIVLNPGAFCDKVLLLRVDLKRFPIGVAGASRPYAVVVFVELLLCRYGWHFRILHEIQDAQMLDGN